MQCLRSWLNERGGRPPDPVFISTRRRPLTTSALDKIVKKHATAAASTCPSIGDRRVSPHTLRHTAAMMLRQAGVDLSVIALWLGHESIETTQMYLHADLASREDAVSRLAPVKNSYRRFHPDDDILRFLEGL